MNESAVDTIVVGAGPYGLAAAAHLQGKGIETRVLGRPMSFWREQMPVGMLLRSPFVACSISDPEGSLTIADYERAAGLEHAEPVPLDRFVDYGDWFRAQAGIDVDERLVSSVSRNGVFRLELEDGDVLTARNVVVAAGIGDFASRPPIFANLSDELVSHACEHCDLGTFAGRRVLVIGGGQSALESAALLHESGAEVEVIVREPKVHWLDFRLQHELGLLSRLMYAPPDVGPMGVSHLVARPGLYRLLPRSLQNRLGPRTLRPAGAGWLVPRVRETKEILLTVGRAAVAADERAGAVHVTLDDGSERTVDHVLLGTGYRVDVHRYPFLSESLLSALHVRDGYPVLRRGLESSVEGLHFAGAPALWSFGPLLRFVAGSGFAAAQIARGIAAHRRRS
jgi:cation diffusion facilitator CzcD-associated flavoprotein CzcO